MESTKVEKKQITSIAELVKAINSVKASVTEILSTVPEVNELPVISIQVNKDVLSKAVDQFGLVYHKADTIHQYPYALMNSDVCLFKLRGPVVKMVTTYEEV